MTKKRKPKKDDPEQSQRFVETARAISATSKKDFESAMGAIASKRQKDDDSPDGQGDRKKPSR